ncbi:copper resistance protein B [Aquisediminimonas sediminicola]|uniref:copper resistance protein B n=1 Tax=Alteraquisediminimonas sediminicola TaxID=2676787 RepID=UPI001C8E0D80|nr:copper resistance protein B [Aquisediminimonas sediminicola]
MSRENPLIAMIMGGLCALAPQSASAMEMANLESGPVQQVHLQDSHPAGLKWEGGFELLEMAINNKEERLIWEGGLSYGSDLHRLVVKFDGGGEIGRRVDEVETQLLYARQISDKVALLGGVRHDWRGAPHNNYAVIGTEIAFSDILSSESFAFLSDRGDLTGETELFIETPINPRLLVDVRAGLGWSAQSIPDEDTWAGLNEAEVSLRLRYTGHQRIVPYIGVAHGRLLGKTADMARAAGEERNATHFVAGLSLAFGSNQD